MLKWIFGVAAAVYAAGWTYVLWLDFAAPARPKKPAMARF